MSNYYLSLELCWPDLDADRLYLEREREVAQREMERTAKRKWMPLSVPGLGLLREVDWRGYLHELKLYEHKLDKYEDELEDGLTPLKVVVANDSQVEDAKVWIQVDIEEGAIHKAKKTPERPKRLDGDLATKRDRFPTITRFVRSKIKVTPHGMQAQFSRLGSGEKAYLVNEVLHVQADEHTRLSYSVHSSRLPEGERGLVEIVESEQSA